MSANEQGLADSYRNRLHGKPITVGHALDAAAAAYPDTDALVFYPHAQPLDAAERLTYARYKQQVDRLAKGLMAIGVGRGDHVAIWMPNCLEWALAQMATGKIGAANVSVNTMLKANEIEYVLQQSDSATLLMADEFLGTDFVTMLEGLAPEIRDATFGALAAARLPRLRNVITLSRRNRTRRFHGFLRFDELMARGDSVEAGALRQRQDAVAEDDVAQVLYTSGTTGLPKGAALVHRGVIENSYLFGIGLGCRHGDVYVNPQPLFHIGCSHLGTYCSLTLGLTLITVDRWVPERNLQIIQKERATTICGTPTHFITMMEHPNFAIYDVSSLRTGIMGGSACPVELVKDVIARMHVRDLTINFGQTESCGTITQTRRDASPELRAETVGVAHLGVEVTIRDPETGIALPAGTVGEICARSRNLMRGYYKDPQATAQAIDREGWLHLGDLGTMDVDGNLRFRGRIKDMLVVGGENVYAAEVEQFLQRHPKVIAAHVVGVPDPKYGEVPVAYLETSADVTLEEIGVFCRGRIASYKIPRYIEINAPLPLTPSAKIQKFRLREMAAARYGAQPL